jgi:hypothetical protein
MTDESAPALYAAMPTLNLVYRLRDLYYAIETAERAAVETLPERYAEDLRAEVKTIGEELVHRIAAAELSPEGNVRAAHAHNTLSTSPKVRARIDFAARVYNAVPAGDYVLGRDRQRLLRANLEAMNGHLNAELAAVRILLDLLPEARP